MSRQDQTPSTSTLVKLHLPDGNHVSHRFSPSSSLLDVINTFEQQQTTRGPDPSSIQQRFSEYIGVPDTENIGPVSNGSSLIRIQYNLPGLMVPTFETIPSLSGDAKSVYSSVTHNLSQTRISSLPIMESRLEMKFYHTYTTANLTQQQKEETLANTIQRLQNQQQPPHELAAPVITVKTCISPPIPISSPSTTAPQYSHSSGITTDSASRHATDTPAHCGKNGDTSLIEDNERRQEQEQGQEQGQGNVEVESSDISSEEVTDSDDDRFYQPNKQDYRIIYEMYQRARSTQEGRPTQQPASGGAATSTVKGSCTFRIMLPPCIIPFQRDGKEHQLILTYSLEVQHMKDDQASVLLHDLERMIHPTFLSMWDIKHFLLLPRRIKIDHHRTFSQQTISHRSGFHADGKPITLSDQTRGVHEITCRLANLANNDSTQLDGVAELAKTILFANPTPE